MKTTTKIIDTKKVTDSCIKAAGLYNKVFWGNKRIQIAQSFMRLSVVILFICISSSIFGQDYLGKTFNTTLKELGGPREDGTTKDGLFFIYYFSTDDGLHVYYFKKDVCVREEIISSYGRWEKYKNKFAGMESKYDIQIVKLKDKFTITIKNL